jgi:hypothetical protein
MWRNGVNIEKPKTAAAWRRREGGENSESAK